MINTSLSLNNHRFTFFLYLVMKESVHIRQPSRLLNVCEPEEQGPCLMT